MANENSAISRIDNHVGYLDGWRGLAIFTLLLGHFFPVPGINFGTVGVNLFFVLSGLLMGGLLFEKREPIPRFYRRRIARIIPAHTAFLVIIAIVYFAIGLPFSLSEFVSALLFVNNYVLPDLGAGHAVMPYGHIWSLSVEEHSYVALSLVAILSRKRLLSSVAGISALSVAIVCFALYYQWVNPPKLAFNQWLHTEVAAYGLFATALWVSAGRRLPKKLNSASAAPVFLLIGIVLHWWSMPLAVQRLVGVGCFAGAICVLSVTRGWFAVILSWAPLRQLGLWSFSMYLWQQPFYLWMHRDTRLSPMLALTAALICGLISYYLIERPARTYLNTHWGVRTYVQPCVAADASQASRR
ncbi:MAG: acyltransferase [Candidatus Accumulibacter sp.]|nr:acyltransferase [Accumulibacter sp.]